MRPASATMCVIPSTPPTSNPSLPSPSSRSPGAAVLRLPCLPRCARRYGSRPSTASRHRGCRTAGAPSPFRSPPPAAVCSAGHAPRGGPGHCRRTIATRHRRSSAQRSAASRPRAKPTAPRGCACHATSVAAPRRRCAAPCPRSPGICDASPG